MARKRIRRLCSIANCGKPHFGYGWCATHYARWRRNGDPLVLQERKPRGLTFIKEVAAAHQSDDCLLWPYGKAHYGYGEVLIDGRKRLAHRVVCEITHGQPPPGKNDTAHSCGNRLCVNPHHLRWATRAENETDKLSHGTSNRGARHGMSKLSVDDVREIRALHRTMRHKDIAKKFGISAKYVNEIASRRSRWAWLK